MARKRRTEWFGGIRAQALIPNRLYIGNGIRILANLIPKAYLSSKRDKPEAKSYPKYFYRTKRDKNSGKSLSQIKNISDLG
jgi:hypothetical protein